MRRTRSRKATEAAEDAEDLRWLRKVRKKPFKTRPFEEVIAEIEAGRGAAGIRHRREVYS